MKITLKWFPRSWIQIVYQDKVTYIDPSYLKTYFIHHPTNIGDGDDGLPEKLQKGDMILYTHSHKDHCKLSTLNQLKKAETVILCPKSCGRELALDFTRVKPGENYFLNGMDIETINAYNTVEGNSTRKVHKKGAGVGYILTLGNFRIYHSGDTDFIPDMLNLRNIDIAFLPIGGVFTMDVMEAIEAVKAIKPRIVIPIHHLNADSAQLSTYFRENDLNVEVRMPSIGDEMVFETR